MFPEKVLGKADPAQNHHCRGAMLRRWLGNGTAGLSRAMNADAKLGLHRPPQRHAVGPEVIGRHAAPLSVTPAKPPAIYETRDQTGASMLLRAQRNR